MPSPTTRILALLATSALIGLSACRGASPPPLQTAAATTSADRADGSADLDALFAEAESRDELEELFAVANTGEQLRLEELCAEAEREEQARLERLFAEADEYEELERLFAEVEEEEQASLERLFVEAAEVGYLERTLQRADIESEKMAYRLEGLSRRIDRFFGADRIYEESTETYLQARADVIYERGGEWTFKNKLRLKLDLPYTEHRLNLLIENDPDDDDPFLTGRPPLSSPGTTDVDPQEYSAALQFFLALKDKTRVSLEPGLKLRVPPEAFLRLRGVNRWDFDDWLLRFTEIFGWYTEEGLRSESRIEFDIPVGESDLLRFTSKALWSEEYVAKRFVVSETAYYVHVLDPKRSVAFDVSATGETQPHWRDTNYFTSIRYRQEIHRGWIFYEIRPFMGWDREEAFRRHPGITVSLELLFGAQYMPVDK